MLVSAGLVAQPAPDTTKNWDINGINTLNFNQTSFSNWTAGGANSLAFSAVGKLHANYTKEKWAWNNNLNLMFGFIKEMDEDFRKNEDLLDLTSTGNYDASKYWDYSLYFNFRSQFYRGNDPEFDSIKVSGFMAPGYMTLSPGMTYRPVEWFSLLLSPITLRATFVVDQDLADLGAYGVDPAIYDSVSGLKQEDGENVRLQYGAYMEARLIKELVQGLNFESKLNIFYTYNDRADLEPMDMDINWENYLNYKLNSWLSMSFFVHMLYFPGQPAFEFDVVDGVVETNAVANKQVQIRQTFGIGLTYTFDNKD